MLRRLVQVVLAWVVLAVGVLAVISALAGTPQPGIGVDDVNSLVTYVDPGSPAWRDGIRGGDQIVELQDANQPGGWRIRTMNGQQTRETFAGGHLAQLRRYVPWSLLALGLAAIASYLAFRQHPASAAVMPLAIAAAAEPLFYAGSIGWSLVAGVAIFGGGALAVLAFTRWRWWIAPVVGAGLFLGAMWVLASTALPSAFDATDAARAPTALGLSGVGFVAVVDRRRLVEFMTGKGGPAFVDLAYVSAFAAVMIAAIELDLIPIEWIAIAALLAAGVFPLWRRKAFPAFERFLTSRARRDAAIKAVEDERGRLAREIHDVPLQELSGVIRRLESMPGAESEAMALRSVAEGLRDVATTLHPPVLHDLGLAAAIADLGDNVSEAHPEWKVVVDVDDVTLVDRPPADVELAAFRVIQEATANAVAHSGGSHLEIGGLVSTDSIELRSTDDGQGFHEEDAREARRNGHFGLDAMRERAAAVGAKVLVTQGPSGASVQFMWERR